MSLDYKIYKELGKSYLNDIKKGIKNLSYKTILPMTLASTMVLYACGGSGGGGSSSGGGTPTVYQCNDNKDNDSDGLVDMLDPGCSSLTDNNENNVPGNQAPVSIASFLYSVPDNSYHPAYVHPGNIVALDGTNAYDPDNSPNALTYLWSLVLKPACSSLTNSNINPNRTANFVGINPDCVGDYTLELQVYDGLDTGSDTVVQSVVDNNAPVANAGNDQSGFVDMPLQFNSSASNDSIDGQITSCSWNWGDGSPNYTETQTSIPDGTFDCRTTHTYASTGGNHCRDPPTCSLWNYEVILEVIDDDNANSTDTIYITINP